MGANTEFHIPFKGLQNGINNYRFQVRTDFFKTFENSRIEEGSYNVDLELEKREDMMILDISFTGTFKTECDRCLSNINIPSKGEDRIIVKIEREITTSDEENVISLNQDEHQLDISEMIFDAIILHLPIKNERDCEKEGYAYCDKQILERIVFNEKVLHKKGTWDILNKLKLNK